MIIRIRVFPRTAIACLLLSIFSISVFVSGSVTAKDNDQSNPVGEVSFTTSCNEAVALSFNRALAKLHHMMYVQAEEEFRAVINIDPECAMAYWGIAMTRFHPLWSGRPSDKDLRVGEDAITKAKKLMSSKHEADYIAATDAFYRDWQARDHRTRLADWESAQLKLQQKYPDDPDAVAFAALARLATAPKKDKTYSQQRVAGQALEALHERHPKHPGGFHYLIHAYDNPVLAARAEDVARGYADIAPDVPHALHMPSHIFVRLGLWPDVVDWNIRSAQAAARQPVNDMVSKHYVHAIDYLVYGYLQQAQHQRALDALDELLAKGTFEPSFPTAYGLAAAQARYPLEREHWADAAKLRSKVPATFNWDAFPAVVAITEFARGLGAARSGNDDVARDAISQLDKLHDDLTKKGDQYWSVLVDSQRTSVAAWLAFAQGQHDRALVQMLKAADLEDSLDKHPVTPGSVLPARELLGDMLLALDRHSEALDAYNQAMATSPNRLRSLRGASSANEALACIKGNLTENC